jgi:hypothetical protein
MSYIKTNQRDNCQADCTFPKQRSESNLRTPPFILVVHGLTNFFKRSVHKSYISNVSPVEESISRETNAE